MALYGILGVQFFGKLISHCVKNTTIIKYVYSIFFCRVNIVTKNLILTLSETKITDFMIPDTYCSPLGPEFGYQCPPDMKCVEIDLLKQERGFNGFDEISKSTKVVWFKRISVLINDIDL